MSKTYIIADANTSLGYRKVTVEGFIPENIICEADALADIPIDAIDLVETNGVTTAVLNDAKLAQINTRKATLASNAEYLSYLASTDWYVIRQQETGIPVPQEVLDARANARAMII